MSDWHEFRHNAPKESGLFLCFHPGMGQFIAYFNRAAGGRGDFMHSGRIEPVTHWQILPDDPITD